MSIEAELPRIPEIQDARLDEVYIKQSKQQWFLGNRMDDTLEEALSLRDLADFSEGRVLEVACGCGERAYALAEVSQGFDITAIDIDPRCIDIAQARYRPMPPNLHFQLGDVYNLSLYDSTIDMVTTSQSLHHFNRLEDALTQILRAMKPGTEFYFMDFNREYLPVFGDTQLPNGMVVPRTRLIWALRKSIPDSEFVELFFRDKIFDSTQNAHANQVQILTICSYLAAYTPLEVREAMVKAGFRIAEINNQGSLLSGIGVK